MTLQTYLKKHDLSYGEFAKSLGVTRAAVWQWVNGYTRITPDRAKQIEDLTGIPRMKLLYPRERS